MKAAAKAASAVAAMVATFASASLSPSTPSTLPAATSVDQGVLAVSREADRMAEQPCLLLGYATGRKCAQGSGCIYKATVTECLECCDKNCNHSGLYVGCAKVCLGDDPETALPRVTRAAGRLRRGEFDQNEIRDLVDIVKAGTAHPNELVRRASELVAMDTPFVSPRQI